MKHGELMAAGYEMTSVLHQCARTREHSCVPLWHSNRIIRSNVLGLLPLVLGSLGIAIMMIRSARATG